MSKKLKNYIKKMRKGSYNGSDIQRLGNKTMNVGTNFRFQNLQKLNTLVGEVSEKNKQSSMRTAKIDMSDKVLDMIKNRIKTNCQKMYENYDENKKVILKQIQQVETNMLSENAISKGFQNIVKEKSTFDRAKAQLQTKQKKLKKVYFQFKKKLIEIRDQLKESNTQNEELIDVLNEKSALIQQFQNYKITLDYQTSILNNMRSQRRQVKLYLKEKYDRMLADEQFKKQRIKKLQNLNHMKKVNLKKIEDELRKEEYCEIPQKLAGELQKRLQEYEGKHIYENIIKHETVISEELRKQVEMQQMRQKQNLNTQRLAKQKQELKQYELAYNFYLIKQQQEEKIKKICGVNSLSQIVNNSLEDDRENLAMIRKQTERAIIQIRKQNKQIQKDIENILTRERGLGNDEMNKMNDLLDVEQQFIESEKELKGLEINAAKKYEMMEEWHRIVQMMCPNREVKKQLLGESLKNILQSISKQDKNEETPSEIGTLDLNLRTKKPKTEQESEWSIIEKNLM